MDELHWLALVIWDEAQGETYLGQAAVGRVVMNRARRKYASDGTIRGTVLWHFQFSGFWFAMEHGHYTQIEKDEAGAQAHGMQLFAQAQNTGAWKSCLQIAEQLMAGKFVSSDPSWPALADAVLYYAPAVCKAPAWATDDRKLATIGHHVFYSDKPVAAGFGHAATEAALG